jgi:hypothetical protein
MDNIPTNNDQWYDLGVNHRNLPVDNTYYVYNHLTPCGLAEAFYLAGVEGSDKPFEAVGWRYGRNNGISRNYAADKSECGKSMAQIKGFDACRSFAAMGSESEKAYYKGWVITHKKGSDGEFLMVGAGKYAATEITKKEYQEN